jgi:pimeloyl-ACP methyl ester carboxylesterase
VIQRFHDLAPAQQAETVIAVSRAEVDVRRYAPSVSCPTTVIGGEFDNAIPVERAHALATALHVELITMSNVGHLPMIEDPSALAKLLAVHLEYR